MEKVKFETIKDSKNFEIEFQGVKVEVKRFIKFSKQIDIIIEYVANYFEDWGIIIADKILKTRIIEELTNLDIESMDKDLIDKLLSETNFYDLITADCYNYDEFVKLLSEIVEEKKRKESLDKSVGSVLSTVAEKVISILDNFSNITPESLENIRKQTSEMIKDLETSKKLDEPIKEVKRVRSLKKKDVDYVH